MKCAYGIFRFKPITVTVDKMRCFTYGSRVIENERQVKLQRHVRKLGNLLHAIVTFVVTFLLFALINVLLSSIVQNAHLTFVKILKLVQEGVEVVLSHSAFSLFSFVYQHSVGLLLAFAFGCLYQFGIVLKALGNGENEAEKEKETYGKRSCQFDTQVGCNAVSYRHKVCFLS